MMKSNYYWTRLRDIAIVTDVLPGTEVYPLRGKILRRTGIVIDSGWTKDGHYNSNGRSSSLDLCEALGVPRGENGTG